MSGGAQDGDSPRDGGSQGGGTGRRDKDRERMRAPPPDTPVATGAPPPESPAEDAAPAVPGTPAGDGAPSPSGRAERPGTEAPRDTGTAESENAAGRGARASSAGAGGGESSAARRGAGGGGATGASGHFQHEDRLRLRRADRRVGAVVLIAAALFIGALLQRGTLRAWFSPTSTLVLVLPEGGVSGLEEGSNVEVLGLQAGTVSRIIVDPNARIRAELRIEEDAKVFIRQDSGATIRRRFGVAGAAYVDIQRGQGEPLDWEGDPPVIEVAVERPATETVGALLDDVRERVFPLLDDARRTVGSLAALAERLERGEGTVGRLLADDTLAREAELTADRAAVTLESLQAVAADAQRLVAALAGTTAGTGGEATGGEGTARATQGGGAGGSAAGAAAVPAAGEAGGVPALLQRADETLATLQRASRDVARATPVLPRAARSVEQGAEALPVLLIQVQETARELELLANQLRSMRLLGGGPGASGRDPMRPGAGQVRP